MQLAFDLKTYRQRLEQVRHDMRAQNLEALVVTLPDSIHWLTGYDTIGYLWSQALLIDLSTDEPVMHTRTTEEFGFRESCWLSDGVFYDIARVNPMQVLASTIRDRGLASSRIGVELRSFTFLPASYEDLRSALPEAAFVDATDVVLEARLIKSPAELTYHREASAIADYAMTRVLQALRPGISEVHLAGIASQALGEAGSEYSAIPPMVVSGPRSALVHAMASRRTIGVGDVVCIELAGVVHRYHGILMRTASIGKPADRVAQVADCLKTAMERAIESCTVGTPVAVPDAVCNEVLDTLDLARRRCHRLGYSTGVAYPPGWLEPMTLVDGDTHTFAPGMSFTIEPNLTLHDEGFGLKLGEIVGCTEAGPQSFSTLPHELCIVD
jgi:Xaa-Pro dipeptidase